MNITNIVAKSQTSRLDLEDVYLAASALGFTAKMTDKFPAVFVKLDGGTCTFFRSGSVTFNGVKATTDLYKLSADAERVVLDRLSSPTVVNIAGSFRRNSKVDLCELSRRTRSMYEPDLTNALEMSLGSCAVLIHHTGNGIITGAKTIDELFNCYDCLLKVLKQ